MRSRRLAAFLVGQALIGPALGLACELPSDSRIGNAALYVVGPRESRLQFDADAGWHTLTGTAGKLAGRVRVAPAFPAAGAEACLEVDAASITTGIAIRDERMRERHLHTDRFPTIRFNLAGLDGVTALGGGRYAGTVRGTLAMHGVTAPLAAPVETRLDANQFSVQGRVALRLSTYGMPAPSVLFVTMKDEVLVRFHLKADRS